VKAGQKYALRRALARAQRLAWQLTKNETENRDDDGARHPVLAGQAADARQIVRTLERVLGGAA